MKIDFEYEISKMTAELKLASGYLECEKVIIKNIREKIAKGIADEKITDFLKKLLSYFGERISSTQQTTDCINYRYAKGFVNNLLTAPYWHRWIMNINL